MPDKRRLFIVGAGSFARELECWLELTPESDRDWELAGFLHSPPDSSPLRGFPSDYGIEGDWRDFRFTGDDCVILGVTDPRWKEQIWDHLYDKVSFLTYVAPSSIVAKFSSLGEGTVIAPNSVVGPNVTVGRAVTINSSSGVGHDARIDDFASLMARVSLGGKVSLGPSTWVGSGAVTLPGIRVSGGARIGAGSVVIRDVRENVTVFGNPAKEVWSR